MDELIDANGKVRGRFSPTIDDVVFDDHPWDPDGPDPRANRSR